MDERGKTDGKQDQATPLLVRSDAAVTRLIRRGEQLNFLGLRRHRRIAPEADICGNLKPISGSKEAGITEFGT